MNALDFPTIVQSFKTASNDMLAAVLDQSADCIKVIGPEGTLDFMNRNGRCAMEIDDFAMVAGKLWWDLWPDDTAPLIREAFEKGSRQAERHGHSGMAEDLRAAGARRTAASGSCTPPATVATTWIVVVSPTEEGLVAGDQVRPTWIARDRFCVCLLVGIHGAGPDQRDHVGDGPPVARQLVGGAVPGGPRPRLALLQLADPPVLGAHLERTGAGGSVAAQLPSPSGRSRVSTARCASCGPGAVVTSPPARRSCPGSSWRRTGGRRHLPSDERGADPWWQVEAFGAYAAHTRTTEFAEALNSPSRRVIARWDAVGGSLDEWRTSACRRPICSRRRSRRATSGPPGSPRPARPRHKDASS